MAHVKVFCFLACYVLAFGLELTRLLRGSSLSRAGALLVGFAGFVAHTSYLLARAQLRDLPPLLSSSHDWLLVLAWISVLFYLFFTAMDRRLAVGLFALPVVLVLIGSAYFVRTSPSELVTGPIAHEAAIHHWTMFHVSLLVFGIAGVIVAFILSLMYLAQHYRLKHKRTLREGLSLPSLARLARWNWWAVMLSVLLVTLGIASGAGLILLTKENAPAVGFADPVVIAYLILWLVMMALFVRLAWNQKPAGKHVAWLTIWAFGFLLASLIALEVLRLDSWHA